MKSHPLIIQAAFFVTLFAIGFGAARLASPQPPTNPIPSTGIPTSPPSRAPGVPVDFAGQLAAMESAAASFAQGNYRNLMKGEHASEAALAWAKSDPSSLWQWLKENEEWRRLLNVGGPLIATWFKEDPEAALQAFRELETWERYEAWQSLSDFLFSDDPKMAQLAGDHLDEFIGVFIPDGDSGTPEQYYKGLETIDKVRKLPDSYSKRILVRSAMAGWFRMDWKAATTWTATLPDAERRAMERALFAWRLPPGLARDPEGAKWVADWLSRPENRDLRADFGEQLAGQIARHDPARALQWATATLSGAAKANAVASIISTQVRNDPTAAISIVDSLPPGGVRLQSGRNLIRSLAQVDPSAAYERALAQQQSGFDVGDRAWAKVGTHLALSKPEEARTYLLTPPSGAPAAFHNNLLAFLASNHARETLQWIQAQTDRRAEIRKSLSDRLIQKWRLYDPVAAEKWAGDKVP